MCAVYQTESESNFHEPPDFPLDNLGRPMRPAYRPRIAKRAELKVLGESDNLIYPTDEPSYSVSVDEIYPEKFEGAAGMTSKQVQTKLSREKMVEFFPERVVQGYLGSESDELMYGEMMHPASQSEVREVH